MRTTARRLLSSTNAATTARRFSVLSTFARSGEPPVGPGPPAKADSTVYHDSCPSRQFFPESTYDGVFDPAQSRGQLPALGRRRRLQQGQPGGLAKTIEWCSD